MKTQSNSKYRLLLLVASFPFFTVWLFLIFTIIYSYFLYVKISNISYEDIIKNKLLDSNVIGTRIIARDDGKLNLLLADSYAEKGNYSVEEDSGGQNSANKDLSRAIKFYKEAIISNPLSGESHLKLGILYANLKMNKEALSELKKAALLDPRNAYHQFDVGRYFLSIKDYKNGFRALKEANTLRFQFLPGSLNLVWDLTQNYQDLISIAPDQQDAFLTLGKFLLGKGLWDKAIIVYKKAISLDSKNPISYQSLSSAYEIKGFFDEALKVIDDGIKILPKHPDMYFYLSVVYFKKNEFNESIFNIKKAISLYSGKSENKNLIEYRHTLAEIYLNKMKDYEKALAETDAILKLNPIEARAYFLKGLCYKNMDSNPAEMINSFKKAAMYNPQNLKYRITLAENFYLYGLYKEALAEWEDIRKLDPQGKIVEQKIKEIKETMKNDQRSIMSKRNYR